jgi:hypothetical protein
MDTVQKPSNSKCHTPWSEPFRIYFILLIHNLYTQKNCIRFKNDHDYFLQLPIITYHNNLFTNSLADAFQLGNHLHCLPDHSLQTTAICMICNTSSTPPLLMCITHPVEFKEVRCTDQYNVYLWLIFPHQICVHKIVLNSMCLHG